MAVFSHQRALPFAMVLLSAIGSAGPVAPELQPQVEKRQSAPIYFWKSLPVGDSAQLATLFCRSCGDNTAAELPLVAVLRDTLGDTDAVNDRVTDVWLLGYARKNVGQRALAAVPFFYWKIGGAANVSRASGLRPLMDLTAPMHPVATSLSRDLLQWTTFDPLTPLRASSRAYRANEVEDERLHLEEAMTMLRQAPSGPGADELTSNEIATVIGRLDLRKQVLGGMVKDRQASGYAERSAIGRETVRARNWELLRQSAEKASLLFEPLNMDGGKSQYGILWYPLHQTLEPNGIDLQPTWKLLNISDPWSDSRMRNWSGPAFDRRLDANGSLLSEGVQDGRPIRLVPLGAYSLVYPKSPLLLVDFRRGLHVRKHEMLQRAVTEVTSGVIGISHFTNWYYYAGAAVYDFISSRHGQAMDLASRIDCYAQFRVHLALDNQLDPRLRLELTKGIRGMSVNPLEDSPQHELQTAVYRYSVMQDEVSDKGKLVKMLDAQRRAELASFGRSKRGEVTEAFLHSATLGIYRKRAASGPDVLAKLNRNRRIEADLAMLHTAAASETQPEVSVEIAVIREAIAELSDLLPEVPSPSIREEARLTIDHVQKLTHDSELRSECSDLMATLGNGRSAPSPSLVVNSVNSVSIGSGEITAVETGQ